MSQHEHHEGQAANKHKLVGTLLELADSQRFQADPGGEQEKHDPIQTW